MKDWLTLQPDRVKLMNKHFTPGMGGNQIEYVVIHHNAGVLSIDQIWDVWQTRAASAHYQVTSLGEIGQLVWDRDTACQEENPGIHRNGNYAVTPLKPKMVRLVDRLKLHQPATISC